MQLEVFFILYIKHSNLNAINYLGSIKLYFHLNLKILITMM